MLRRRPPCSSIDPSQLRRLRPDLVRTPIAAARLLGALLVSAAVARPVGAAAAAARTEDDRPGSDSPPSAPDQQVPLSLAQAEQAALRHQPTLRQARGQTEAAAGRVEQARSGYLPQASASAVYQRTTGNFAVRPGAIPSATTTTGGWTNETFNYYNLGFSASQLIYDFGQTSGRWRAAAANRDAAVENEITTQEQALLSVRVAYFQGRAQRDLVAVAVSTVNNQQKHLDQIQAFVRAGIRPDIDLAQARTALANAKLQLVTANNNDAVAQAQLNQAMGLFTSARYQLADSALPGVLGEDGALAPLVDQALGARPELKNIQRQRRAQELTISALRGGYGPSLAATGGGTDVGPSLDRLVPNWFVGLTLSWPFLQGGLTRGQIHEANGTLETLAADEEILRLQVSVGVEQAQLAVRAGKSSMVATQEALVNAREQLRLAEARYATGLGSVIELGDAQIAASTAAAQDVQARFSLSAARAQLLTALGAGQ
jgi:outer membrane protein